MGLFKKENCCLCGGKTGLFDKKCQDGKICKDCQGKLSVWFDDYKDATADSLNEQIAQKATDAEDMKLCNFSKVFGEFGVILLDEEKRKFAALRETSSGLFGSQRSVKSFEDIADLNPDLISFDQVKDFEIDITEGTREEKQTVNGQQVSYDPPHILYMYTFTLRLQIDHPYIHSVHIQLNNGAVQIKNVGRRLWTNPGRKLAAHLLNLPGLILEDRAAIYDNESLLASFLRSPYEMPEYSYGFKCSIANWKDIQKYQYYLVMAREIQRIITGKE